MAWVEYTAADRAPLVTGHSVGTIYQIDLKLISYSKEIDQQRTINTAMNSRAETVVKRVSLVYMATVSWPDSIDANMDEFLFSIAGGELFTFDPYGTVAVPDTLLDVVSVGSAVQMMTPIQRIRATTRRTSLVMRPSVSTV